MTDADRAGADLDWQDGVPVSRRHADPYYSLTDGLAETRAVYLEGCRLPGRYAPGFVLAELGVGVGLNLCAAWAAWRKARPGGPLRYVGFEAYPVSGEDVRRALAPFDDIAAEAAMWAAAWGAAEGDGILRIGLPGLAAEVHLGDARAAVPAWEGAAEAWFLDGFAPARNPDLWEPGLMEAVARRTAPGGRLATYSAAGAVRRALAHAGLEVERVPGHGRKRHMTRARKV